MVTKKKTAWERSKFGKLHLVDFLNSLYDSAGASISAMVALFNADSIPFIKVDALTPKQVIWTGVFMFVSTMVIGLGRKWGTNSNGEAFKKE